MTILAVGLVIGVVAVVTLIVPKGEKVDFYEQSFEVK